MTYFITLLLKVRNSLHSPKLLVRHNKTGICLGGELKNGAFVAFEHSNNYSKAINLVLSFLLQA